MERIVADDVTMRFVQVVDGGPIVLQLEGLNPETGERYTVELPVVEE